MIAGLFEEVYKRVEYTTDSDQLILFFSLLLICTSHAHPISLSPTISAQHYLYQPVVSFKKKTSHWRIVCLLYLLPSINSAWCWIKKMNFCRFSAIFPWVYAGSVAWSNYLEAEWPQVGQGLWHPVLDAVPVSIETPTGLQPQSLKNTKWPVKAIKKSSWLLYLTSFENNSRNIIYITDWLRSIFFRLTKCVIIKILTPHRKSSVSEVEGTMKTSHLSRLMHTISHDAANEWITHRTESSYRIKFWYFLTDIWHWTR